MPLPHHLHPLAFRESRLDAESLQQLFPVGFNKGAIDPDFILLLYFMPRMREDIRQVAIICEQQQPLALVVEAADIVHARPGFRQKIEDRPAATLVVRAADVSRGFV
jgi:hypothetical protein